MNTSHITLGGMVTGLAFAAAWLTGNFVEAAEDKANVAVRQTMRAASSDADLSFALGDDSYFASSVQNFERGFVWVYHPNWLLLFADPALIDTPSPAPVPYKETGPTARRGSARRTAILVTDAQAATEEDRNEADLNALFAVAVRVKPARVEAAKNAQGERGKRVYLDLCFACHQPDGRGLPGTFPTLAKSDYMTEDRTRAIRVVLEGLAGPVTVNGETINSVMPAQKTVLTDEQIADVLTYAFNSWENPGGEFTASQVAAIRREKSLD